LFTSNVVTPGKKAALMAFIREGQGKYVGELAARANTPLRRRVLPHLLHAMAVQPGKIAVVLKQVGYGHKEIAKQLFELPRVRQIDTPLRGKVQRFNEMTNEGAKIISSLRDAGFKQSSHIAEALSGIDYPPQEITRTMLSSGYKPNEVALGLMHIDAPNIGSVLHAVLASRSTTANNPKKKNRLGALVAAALNSVGVEHSEIAKTLQEGGHSGRAVVNHLQAIGLTKAGEVATALHEGGGFSGEDIARGMIAGRYSSREVLTALRDLSVSNASDALHKALAFEKYRGKDEQKLANEFTDALKHIKLNHVAIAAVLHEKGYAANKIVAALKANGFTSPADVVDALKKSGFDDFQTANYMSGEFTNDAIAKGLQANGVKDISATIHKVLQVTKYPDPSSGVKLCGDLASTLKSLGYDHRKISAELRALDYGGEVIASVLRNNNFTSVEVAKALRHVNYNSNDIAHFMLSSGYPPLQVAIELNALSLPNMGAALHNALVKKYGGDNVEKTSGLTAGVLKAVGFDNLEIARSLFDAGHDSNVIAASFIGVGVKDAKEISHSLYSVGVSHAKVAEALLSNKFSPVQVAVELHSGGATYGEIQRVLAKGNVSGSQLNNALEAIGFNK
ncbi:MAG: hypothetical protein Q8R15_01440, partial [Candidatus Micrarchaeota archaeon]|nr:hypothetical protein [Candidatus Micrarchaeota archaeon]